MTMVDNIDKTYVHGFISRSACLEDNRSLFDHLRFSAMKTRSPTSEGASEHRRAVTMLPLVENARSDGTEVATQPSYLRATRASTGISSRALATR
jgi:hypothetical protein